MLYIYIYSLNGFTDLNLRWSLIFGTHEIDFLFFFTEWFDVDTEHNTKIYVTNLPLDITEAEFVEIMQKCGLVMRDPDSGKMKVKLYTEPGTKHLKGDALCTYIKVKYSYTWYS